MAGGKYIGVWGAFSSPTQKGVTSFAMSPNRQKPLAGTGHAAIFNVARRVRGSILYVATPFTALYFLVSWANHRNEFLNSKEGRALYAESEE